MKSLQEIMTLASNWFQENPGTARGVGILSIVVLVIGILGSGGWWSEGTVSLFHSRDLTRDEMGLMQIAFGKSGLNDYEVKDSRVVVPKSKRADYLKSLADHGAVPLDLNSNIESDSSFDFFQTRAQQRNRQLARKKQTIRDMVVQLRFVQRAIVDYDETTSNSPFEPMQRTAVVNVTPATNRALDASEVKAIRDTVCGAVAGLQTENITIIDTFASKSHTGFQDQSLNAMQPHTRSKLQAERKYENKIRSALTAYPGIRVNVEVSVDPVVRRIRDERSVDGDSVVVARTVQTETSGRVPLTRPKFTDQKFGIGANGQARVLNASSPTQRSTEFTESISSGTFETTETAGNVVKTVSVSIGVPERCVRYLAHRETTPESPMTVEQIRQQHQQVMDWLTKDIQTKVGPLLPISNGAAPEQQIVVTMDREIRLEEPVAKNRAQEFLSQNWPFFALLTIGFWAFLLLRSQGPKMPSPNQRETTEPQRHSIESTSTSPPTPVVVPLPDLTPSVAANTELPTTSHTQMQTQLDQWCRENPDAAAATIRQWLEKAG